MFNIKISFELCLKEYLIYKFLKKVFFVHFSIMLTIFSKYVKILQLSLQSEDLTNKTLNAANAFVSSPRSALSMLVNDAVFQAAF